MEFEQDHSIEQEDPLVWVLWYGSFNQSGRPLAFHKASSGHLTSCNIVERIVLREALKCFQEVSTQKGITRDQEEMWDIYTPREIGEFMSDIGHLRGYGVASSRV
ncbi:hypothetical protein BTVI_116712 [Pitangus sulphuratus]|nr:hypothetical protein BTVI_116712 [Pitangus sulphuratus]